MGQLRLRHLFLSVDAAQTVGSSVISMGLRTAAVGFVAVGGTMFTDGTAAPGAAPAGVATGALFAKARDYVMRELRGTHKANVVGFVYDQKKLTI